MKKVLYIGWLGFNNLGDEIMWGAFKHLAATYQDKSEWKITPYSRGTNIDLFDKLVLGGGSLLEPGYLNLVYPAIATGKDVLIWGSGIDWLTRQQLDQLMKNQLDFDYLFNRAADAKLRETITGASYVSVRGPLTYAALQRSGIPMDTVRISGDPAYLLQPEVQDVVFDENLDEWFHDNKVVGLNWGTARNRIYGGNETRVEDSIIHASKELIKEGYKLYIYSVWDNDQDYVNRLYRKIDNSDNVILDSRRLNYFELLDIMKRCIFTINLKLHANVLSSVANTPFVALGYRFKVFDFAHSIGLGNYVVPTDSSHLSEDILATAKSCVENKADILSNLNKYRREYDGYLEFPFTNNLFTK